MLQIALFVAIIASCQTSSTSDTGNSDELNINGLWIIDRPAIRDGVQFVSKFPDLKDTSSIEFDGTLFKQSLSDEVITEGTYSIDQSKTPARFDMQYTKQRGKPIGDSKKIKVKGIIKIEDNKLHLLLVKPGDDYPNDFKTRKGDGKLLRVFHHSDTQTK